MAGFQNAAALLILYAQLHIMLGLPHRLPPFGALRGARGHEASSTWRWARPPSRHLGRRPHVAVSAPALLGLLFGTLAYYLLVAAGLEAKLGHHRPHRRGQPGRVLLRRHAGVRVHRAAIDMLPTLLLFAFSLAVVASLDTLICSRIVEGMTGQRTAANRVLRLIGGANLITPLLGGICGGVSVASSTAATRAARALRWRFSSIARSFSWLSRARAAARQVASRGGRRRPRRHGAAARRPVVAPAPAQGHLA